MTDFLSPRILAKLDSMAARHDELMAQSSDPEVLQKPERLKAVQRELGPLRGTVDAYHEFGKLVTQIADNRSLSEPGADPELAELAQAELPELESAARQCADRIVDGLLSEASQGERNAIIEIRAGTGGEEAALWARDLFEMYSHYCESMGWKVEELSKSRSDMDGFKEIVFSVRGVNVFKYLRFESGGHRVQRVPATESQGRVHTSAATVAVLPEAEEVDIDVNPADLEFQAMRASGPGGQNVNKVSSAVRLTHKPSGVVVTCQEERSQYKNKQKALKMLRARLYDAEQQKVEGERAAERRSQVGSGDRNARIRTYNFPQSRATDHRIKQNFALEPVREGRLEPVMEALLAWDRELRINEL